MNLANKIAGRSAGKHGASSLHIQNRLVPGLKRRLCSASKAHRLLYSLKALQAEEHLDFSASEVEGEVQSKCQFAPLSSITTD